MEGMSKEAMEYLVSLGCKTKDINTFEHNGEIYYMDHDGDLRRVPVPAETRPDGVMTRTLRGLVDYLRHDIDDVVKEAGPLMVFVEGYERIAVLTKAYGRDKKRDLVARCYIDLTSFPFDYYLDSEDFMVKCMTLITQTEDRDKVLSLVGRLKHEQSNEVADDGISQRVTVKTGVAAVGDVAVKNPVYLAPWRTFQEVEQPTSAFVLRFREGPQVALFEADGEGWKNQAVANIGDWLRRELAGINVVVIA